MHRYLLSSLIILIAVLTVQPLAAGEPTAREVERMAVKFERLFQSMSGSVARQDLVFTDHGGGLYSLQLSLDGVDRTGVPLRDEDDKPIRLLAAGHMAAEPASPSLAMNAIVSSPEVAYNIWWAVVNQGDEDQSLKTSLKIAGPEEFVLEVSDKVDYLANQVQLIWFNPELLFAAPGIYTHRTTVRSGGKNLYKFWVE